MKKGCRYTRIDVISDAIIDELKCTQKIGFSPGPSKMRRYTGIDVIAEAVIGEFYCILWMN